MPKFQRRPSRLLIGRRLLTFHSPPKIRSVSRHSPHGHRPLNRAFAVKRFRSKIKAARSNFCWAVAARSPLGDQSVTGRRFQNLLAAFDLAASNFDLNRSTANARLGRCPGGDRPGTERILVPRRSPAGCRPISLKSAGGRWETNREPVGRRSITARHVARGGHGGGGARAPPKMSRIGWYFVDPFFLTSIDYMYVPPPPPNIKLWQRAWSQPGCRLDELPDFAQFWPKIDRRPTGNRQGTAQASLGIYSLLDFSKNCRAMPKFQRRPSRLLIGRSLLWVVTIALDMIIKWKRLSKAKYKLSTGAKPPPPPPLSVI